MYYTFSECEIGFYKGEKNYHSNEIFIAPLWKENHEQAAIGPLVFHNM